MRGGAGGLCCPRTRGDQWWRGWGNTSQEEAGPGCRKADGQSPVGPGQKRSQHPLTLMFVGGLLWSDCTGAVCAILPDAQLGDGVAGLHSPHLINQAAESQK